MSTNLEEHTDTSAELDPTTAWLWAAVCAVEQRRLAEKDRSALPAGHGDDVAELMVLRALDPDKLSDLVAGQNLRDRLRKARPWKAWEREAADLWERLDVHVEPEAMELGFHRVTPYHLLIATDPRHPYYIRRARRDRRITLDFVEAMKLAGTNNRIMFVARENDAAGFPHLYVGAGVKRLRGSRMANEELLTAHAAVLKTSMEPLDIEPPRLIRYLRIELCEPTDFLDKCKTDHDHQDAETEMERAYACDVLRDKGHATHEIAALKHISHDTVQNLLSLLKLHEELQDALDAEQLASRAAYKIVKLPREDQIELWRRIKNLPLPEQMAHISARLAGKKLPPKAVKPPAPLPSKTLRQVARIFPKVEKGTELNGLVVGLELASGNTAALARLPRRIQDQVRRVLDPSGKGKA